MVSLFRRRRQPEPPQEFVRMADAVAMHGIEEARLRALLLAGRLRGFRDQSSVKFLRSELDAVARSGDRA